jgi:hypothetical protein
MALAFFKLNFYFKLKSINSEIYLFIYFSILYRI